MHVSLTEKQHLNQQHEMCLKKLFYLSRCSDGKNGCIFSRKTEVHMFEKYISPTISSLCNRETMQRLTHPKSFNVSLDILAPIEPHKMKNVITDNLPIVSDLKTNGMQLKSRYRRETQALLSSKKSTITIAKV